MTTLGFVLILLGLVLLFGELLLPTGGILAVVAAGAIIGGLTLLFYHADTWTSVTTLIAVLVAIPLVTAFGLWLWPRTPLGRLLVMNAPAVTEAGANRPEWAKLDELNGRLGRAMSSLRPSGAVEFEGKRVDCLSEGPLIEAGQWVRCVAVRGGRVIVRPVDPPSVASFESAEFN